MVGLGWRAATSHIYLGEESWVAASPNGDRKGLDQWKQPRGRTVQGVSFYKQTSKQLNVNTHLTKPDDTPFDNLLEISRL